MNILCLGQSVFPAVLQKMGHQVHSLVLPGQKQANEDIVFDYLSSQRETEQTIKEITETNAFDFILLIDNSTPLVFHGIENLNIPIFWYAIDTHLHHLWHKHYAPIFDHVFSAQQNHILTLMEYCNKVSWLPLFFSRDCKLTPFCKRDIEISFVGKIDSSLNPRRSSLIQSLLDQKINLTVTTGDYLPIYQRSRIVINQSVNDDLNLRFFEAAGCGALLISERLSHSNTCILTPEEDYLLYEKDNSEDLILKIKWVQSNIKEAEEMAERAYFKIHNNHLIHHRCQTILDKAASTKAAHPRSIASISHLAFAYMINSQLALPDYICTEYVAMAKKKALEILSTDKTNPWATAVLLC